MNDSELQPLSQTDLATRVVSLQRQVFILLLVSLVLSVTLWGYLFYQDHISHKDANAIRPQATQIINTYSAASAGLNHTAVTNFIAQIVGYAQRNPDFAQQVMKKYGYVPPAAGTQPKPAPAAPAAPKK